MKTIVDKIKAALQRAVAKAKGHKLAAPALAAVCLSSAVVMAVLSGQPKAYAQPVPGYDASSLVYKTGGTTPGWTNRIGGSTSITNWTRIDISAAKNGVAVEMEIQNVASAAANCTLYLAKSVDPVFTNTLGSITNIMDQFSSLTVASSGTALTTTTGHTNYFMAGAGDQSIAGYPYLWLGILTNASATGANYMTNVVVYVRVQ